MPGGRPLMFETPEELQSLIDKYFTDDLPVRITWSNGVKCITPCPTISGLALYLGFCDRHSMYDYEKREQFSHTIKRARANITRYHEEIAQGGACSGAIFMLKNFGYTDKSEIDLNATVQEMPTIKRDGKDLKFNIGKDAVDEPGASETT